MLRIIYTKSQLINHGKDNFNLNSEIVIVPLQGSSYNHPAAYNNNLLLLYIYNITDKNEYIIVFTHPEYSSNNTSLTIKDIDFNNVNKIYTLNKKQLLQATSDTFPSKKIIDINLLYYTHYDRKLIIKKPPIYRFYNDLYKNKNLHIINKLIPIYKHYEFFSNIIKNNNQILNLIKEKEPNDFYNDLVLSNFAEVEKAGLYIDKKLFRRKFQNHSNNNKKNCKNNIIYTEYNINTSTNRPSNKHNGINFAALNKKDNTREIFKSRFKKNGLLLEYDFSSYHLYLVAKLINFKFPEDISAHEYLAKYYFKKKNPTDEEIKVGKSLTFSFLYGNIEDEYKDILFFKKVQKFINQLWEEYKIKNYIKLPLSQKKISNITDNNKNKLFSYYMQGFETERNAVVLYDLLSLLKKGNYKSKIILYTYDSFLIDFNFQNDGVSLIKKIKKTISSKEFPVRIKYGADYKNLKKLNLK